MCLDIFAQCPSSNKISGRKIPFCRLAWFIELNFRIFLWCFIMKVYYRKTLCPQLLAGWCASERLRWAVIFFSVKLETSSYETQTLNAAIRNTPHDSRSISVFSVYNSIFQSVISVASWQWPNHELPAMSPASSRGLPAPCTCPSLETWLGWGAVGSPSCLQTQFYIKICVGDRNF